MLLVKVLFFYHLVPICMYTLYTIQQHMSDKGGWGEKRERGYHMFLYSHIFGVYPFFWFSLYGFLHK